MSTHANFPRLARLLAPVTPEDFSTRYWEREHLRVPRADRGAEGAASPLTLAEVDAILTSRPHYHPNVALTDAVRQVAVEEYADDTDVIDPIRAFKRFATGATFIINRIDEFAPRVRELCSSMEAELGIHVQANMYLTPPKAQGFPIHYDNHDVIIVQCEGAKRWRLYESPKPLPMRGERFESAVTKPGPLTHEFVMETGDVLYVPRGMMHDAVAEGDALSLHVTVGLHAVRWSEVLLEAIAAAAVDDIELRKGMPFGALTGRVPESYLADTLKNHASRVLANVRWERVRDRVATQYQYGHKESLGGMLLDTMTTFNAETVFVPREGAAPRIEAQDNAVVLTVQGRATRWPAHAKSTLEVAISRERFTVGDLGDALDEKGRLTLVRRLVAEGAIRVHREAP